MGIDVTRYLGPYVEAEVKIQEVVVDTCEKKKECPDPKSGYCSVCGIKASSRFKKRNQEVPEYLDGMGATKEAMCETSGMSSPDVIDGVRTYRYIPNMHRDAPRNLWLRDEVEDLHIEMGDLDVKKEINWFEKAFAKEIEIIRKHYGTIKIKWGYIQWCS